MRATGERIWQGLWARAPNAHGGRMGHTNRTQGYPSRSSTQQLGAYSQVATAAPELGLGPFPHRVGPHCPALDPSPARKALQAHPPPCLGPGCSHLLGCPSLHRPPPPTPVPPPGCPENTSFCHQGPESSSEHQRASVSPPTTLLDPQAGCTLGQAQAWAQQVVTLLPGRQAWAYPTRAVKVAAPDLPADVLTWPTPGAADLLLWPPH